MVHRADRRVGRHPERRHLPRPAGAQRADDRRSTTGRARRPAERPTRTATRATSPTSTTPPTGSSHDLSLPANEVPAFNWITPNNCSDAHDATCQGNNLSGAFNADGTPDYTPAGLPAYDPEATTPTNYTGGLYASDLFLRYYIPLIEQSAAFKDGGLIDITFDEANPPFTIGNSFNNVPAPGDSTTFSAPADQPTYGAPGSTAPGRRLAIRRLRALADAAGENIDGVQRVDRADRAERPRGDQQLAAISCSLGPEPPASSTARPASPARARICRGSPGSASEPAIVAPGSSMVNDPKINADDTGRLVSGTDARQRDPAGHLRRSGQQHRAATRCRRMPASTHGGQQLRQALDRDLPAAQRQRSARRRCRTASTATSPSAPRERPRPSAAPAARAATRRRPHAAASPPIRSTTPPTSRPAAATPAAC